MKIADSIVYVGVNDHEIDLFEGQYVVPEGMSYNSYVISDEKIAVMDSVDAGFTAEWLDNVEKVCEGRTPDYLIVQHMEPDHSGSIAPFMEKYPEAYIVASDKAFGMMKKFYGSDYPERRVVIKEGDTLDLGSRALTFVAAPMVHWPEVMVTYDAKTKTLFSADGFGKFGALDSEDDDWACEARRYYFGIVGKFGMQVQNLLKKASALEIEN
ncbi:MAG: FprA family A-type flavoprotein, partial [Anaerovoracaceae bacterium]